MNDPKRLLESGSPRLRQLVLAGKRDAPEGRTEAAVLGALGLGAAGGAAIGAGHAAQTATRSSLARVFAGIKHAAFSKVGVGMIAAATAGGSGYVLGRDHERAATVADTHASPTEHHSLARTPQSLSMTARAAPVATSAPPSPSALTPPAVAAVATGPSTASASAKDRAPVEPRDDVVPAPVVPPTPIATAPSIGEQLASIRRARALVQSGDGEAARRELDAYEARSPHGAFEEEQLALRVRALRLSGDASGAARELANLQARFPSSVHLAALAR